MKILYIGNFLKNIKNHYDGPNIQLVKLFRSFNYNVQISGTIGNKILRMIQFVYSILLAKFRGTDLVIIDVFSTWAFYFAVTVSRIASFVDIPYLLILHGGNLPSRFNSSYKISKKILENAKLIISPSDYLASTVNNLFGLNVLIIPNLIDVKIHQTFNDRKNEIFWVRSIKDLYNPNMAIEVMKILKEKKINFKLYVIGPYEKSEKDKIVSLISRYDLKNNVFLKGRMERDKWHRMAEKGTYFINTTNVDNTPSSVIEALALGLITVSTNVGGIPFILKDGFDSILVKPNDALSMANAIVELENNIDKKNFLKKNAKNKFDNIYERKQVVLIWKKLLAKNNFK